MNLPRHRQSQSPRTSSRRARRLFAFGSTGFIAVFTCALLFPLFSTSLRAADASWKNNGNGTWTNSANWTAANPSSATDTATFGNVITGNRTITLDANRSIESLFFDSTYTYTISGTANALTLNGSTGLTLNGSGGALINVGTLTLASSQTWTGTGTGNVTVQNAIAGSGASLTKSGGFTLTLNGANTFSGGLTASGGVTEFGSNTAAGSGTLTLAGGTIRATGGSRTLANTVNVAADTTIDGSQALTLAGPMTLSGGSKVFTIDSTAATTFAGSIGQQSNAGFTKAGSGQLILSGSNTFTGAVAVTDGTLTLRHQYALGETGTWGNYVASGATLALENNISIKEGSFTLAGTGDGGVGALRNVSGNNTFSAFILTGTATTIASDAGTLDLSGTVYASQALTFGGSGNLVSSGSLQGNASITKTGSGTLTYSGNSANVFSGTTTVDAGTLVLAKSAGTDAIASNITINNGGTVRLDASNQIKDSGAVVTVNQGGTLNLNNNSDAIAALTLTGGNVTTGTGTLTLANTGNGTLTTNASATSATISGKLGLAAYSHTFAIANGAATNDLALYASLSGSGNLIKTGAGTLAFGGVSSGYTGSIFLNEGAISFLADNIFTSSTDLTMAGGILFLNDTSQIFDVLAITGNSIIDFGASSLLNINSLTIAEGSTLTITNWTQSIDYFYSQFAPGSADLSRIIFANSPSSGTAWQGWDKQITPAVPEPATYGALLTAAAVSLYFWRRKQ